MKEVIEFNMDYVERYFREKRKEICDKADDTHMIKTDDLFALWQYWCDDCNINSKMDKPTFSKRLTKLISENNWEFIKKSSCTNIRKYHIDKPKHTKFVGLDFQQDD
jgi:hypothetical protein